MEAFEGPIDQRNVFLHHKHPEEVFVQKTSLLSRCLVLLLRNILQFKQIRKSFYWVFKKYIDTKICDLTYELLDRKHFTNQLRSLNLPQFHWLQNLPSQPSAQVMRVQVLQATVEHLKKQGIIALADQQFWSKSEEIRENMPNILHRCWKHLQYKEERPDLQHLYGVAKKVEHLFQQTFRKGAEIPAFQDSKELSCAAHIRSQSIQDIATGQLDAFVEDKLKKWKMDALSVLVYSLFSTDCLAKYDRPDLAAMFRDRETLVQWIREAYGSLKQNLTTKIQKKRIRPQDCLSQLAVRSDLVSSSGTDLPVAKQKTSDKLVRVVRGGGLLHMLDFFAGRSSGTPFDDGTGHGLYFHKNEGDHEGCWISRSRYYAQSRAPLRSDIPCLLYAEVPSDALVKNDNGDYEWMLHEQQREHIQNIRLEILPLTFSLEDE